MVNLWLFMRDRWVISKGCGSSRSGLAFERHCLAECRAGLRSQLFLETPLEDEVSGVGNESAHLWNLAINGQ